jgi:hypothetical protein
MQNKFTMKNTDKFEKKNNKKIIKLILKKNYK